MYETNKFSMKKIFTTLFLILSVLMANSQTKIILSSNGKTRTATLADNKATEELLKILPVTIEMSPYGGFEVVGALPQSLPTSNSQINTEPGDIMLYQGNQLVIFYGNNSWSYTRIGKIDDATSSNVKEFLGNGNISVTLSRENAGIKEIKKDDIKNQEVFELTGRKVNVRDIKKGVYIVNGEKTLIK